MSKEVDEWNNGTFVSPFHPPLEGNEKSLLMGNFEASRRSKEGRIWSFNPANDLQHSKLYSAGFFMSPIIRISSLSELISL